MKIYSFLIVRNERDRRRRVYICKAEKQLYVDVFLLPLELHRINCFDDTLEILVSFVIEAAS